MPTQDHATLDNQLVLLVISSSSFTRHGTMSLIGALADAHKSATRLYVNYFEDQNGQNAVDLLHGRLYGENSVDLVDSVND